VITLKLDKHYWPAYELDRQADGNWTRTDVTMAIEPGLHESLGFRTTGHLHEVGYKFGRWLDLKFMQRLI
jgi:hypothetical protein